MNSLLQPLRPEENPVSFSTYWVSINETTNYYLMGREFILEVDHKPLVYMSKNKGSNDKVLRWCLALQPYRYRIVHIAGEDNVGADLLSRSFT